MDTKTPGVLANHLLAALPHTDLEALRNHFAIIPVEQGTALLEVDDEVDQVFFPLSGMISLLVILPAAKGCVSPRCLHRKSRLANLKPEQCMV